MENCFCPVTSTEDLSSIFHTIFLFLEHQHFQQTCIVFKKECETRGFNVKKYKSTSSGNVNEKLICTNADPEYCKSAKIIYKCQNEAEPSSSSEEMTKKTTTGSSNSYEFVENQSRIEMEEYERLKDKFKRLRQEHQNLMDELQEKSNYLVACSAPDKVDDTQQTCPGIGFHGDVNISEVCGECSCACKCSDSGTCQIFPTGIKQPNKEHINQTSSPMQFSEENVPQKLFIDRQTSYSLQSEVQYADPFEEGDNYVVLETADKTKVEIYVAKDHLIVPPNSEIDPLHVDNSAETLVLDENLKVSELEIESCNDSEENCAGRYSFSENRIFCDKCTEVKSVVRSAPPVLVLSASRDEDIEEEEESCNCEPFCITSMPSSPRKFLPNSSYFELDYSFLKKDLIDQSERNKALLFQALRWRITRSTPVEREHIMNSYVSNDILCIHCEKNFLRIFIEKTPLPILEESIARFVNAIASVRLGRDYLSSKDEVIKNFLIPKVAEIETVSQPTVIHEMILVTLQKLSIRKAQRSLMISENLLDYVLIVLEKDRTQITIYCLEYCCALLMNLCLQKETKTILVENPERVMKIFGDLLEDGDTVCLPYVSGGLYSLLSENSIKKAAKRQQIDLLIFQRIKKTSDRCLRKQLDFILRSRFGGEEEDSVHDVETEEFDEVDLLEPELDQKDALRGSLVGEELLELYKLDVGENWDILGCMCKPVTPFRKIPNVSTVPVTAQTELPRDNDVLTELIAKSNKNSPQKEVVVKDVNKDLEQMSPQCVCENTQTALPTKPVTPKEFMHKTFENDSPSVEHKLEETIRPPKDYYGPNMCIPQSETKTHHVCKCQPLNKYRCGCYDMIKQSLDNDDQQDLKYCNIMGITCKCTIEDAPCLKPGSLFPTRQVVNEGPTRHTRSEPRSSKERVADGSPYFHHHCKCHRP